MTTMDIRPGQRSTETHSVLAGADPDPHSDQSTRETHDSAVGVGPSRPSAASCYSKPKDQTLRLADPLLTLAADVLEDLERVRIANENRLRELIRSPDQVKKDGTVRGLDKDGKERGLGLEKIDPDVVRLASIVRAMLCDSKEAEDVLGEPSRRAQGCCLEHDAERNLKQLLRQHPLGPWVKATVGVGEKRGARLLAAIGDPYWNTKYDRPRTVDELWAYCGYHVLHIGHGTAEAHRTPAGVAQNGSNPDQIKNDAQQRVVGVAATRARGQKANWSAKAKMRAYLIAESCMKARSSPYRAVYDAGRIHYADALHDEPCRRCGPAGKPAPVGSPLSAGHQHARALRKVAKELLKDLWIAARQIHTQC